jgi:hypothetical protein
MIDQHRLDLVVTGKQSFDQRAAFGDESTAPSRQVATAKVQVGLEAWVVQAVDLKLAQLRIPVFVAYRALRSRKTITRSSTRACQPMRRIFERCFALAIDALRLLGTGA